MNLIKNNKKIKLKGIVHFWDLPNNLCIVLDPQFKDKLMKEFMKIAITKYNASKITGISRPTISDYINKKNHKMRMALLLRIANIINNGKFNFSNIEKKILWIGDVNSQGIINPKLPFNFNSREGSRFLAAICNEGWISDGAYYSNSNQELRASVK